MKKKIKVRCLFIIMSLLLKRSVRRAYHTPVNGHLYHPKPKPTYRGLTGGHSITVQLNQQTAHQRGIVDEALASNLQPPAPMSDTLTTRFIYSIENTCALSNVCAFSHYYQTKVVQVFIDIQSPFAAQSHEHIKCLVIEGCIMTPYNVTCRHTTDKTMSRFHCYIINVSIKYGNMTWQCLCFVEIVMKFLKTACSIIYNRYQFVKRDNRTQMVRRTPFYV